MANKLTPKQITLDADTIAKQYEMNPLVISKCLGALVQKGYAKPIK